MQETDGNLLQRFAAQGDEAAFEALAARYLGLIFPTPQLEDVPACELPICDGARVSLDHG